MRPKKKARKKGTEIGPKPKARKSGTARKRPNRTRAQRQAAKPKPPKPEPTPAVTMDTTGEAPQTLAYPVDGSRIADPNCRRALDDFARSLSAGLYTEEEVVLMAKVIPTVMAKGNHAEKLAAHRAWMQQSRLFHDIERSRRRLDLKISPLGRGSELASIAAEIGLQISIEEVGGSEGDIIEGQSRRPQSED